MESKNEISTQGIILGGFLLVLFLIMPIALIIGLWPDRIPENEISTAYTFKLFDIHLYQSGQNQVGQTFTQKINLSTLLLLLVALCGFLGNMIHISGSFVSFVGAKQFKRAWTLWYFVKPFSAAGLAIVLYFALRAGFFSASANSSSINIYGIMTIAVFTGLFTDTATLKLKEIFEMLFKPKDSRPDKLKTD